MLSSLPLCSVLLHHRFTNANIGPKWEWTLLNIFLILTIPIMPFIYRTGNFSKRRIDIGPDTDGLKSPSIRRSGYEANSRKSLKCKILGHPLIITWLETSTVLFYSFKENKTLRVVFKNDCYSCWFALDPKLLFAFPMAKGHTTIILHSLCNNLTIVHKKRIKESSN